MNGFAEPPATLVKEIWSLFILSELGLNYISRGLSGHFVLFLVALSFSKLHTLLNNIQEGNPLKSVYLTPKIAFTFRPM